MHSTYTLIKRTVLNQADLKDSRSVFPIDAIVRHALVGTKVIPGNTVQDDCVSHYLDSVSQTVIPECPQIRWLWIGAHRTHNLLGRVIWSSSCHSRSGRPVGFIC